LYPTSHRPTPTTGACKWRPTDQLTSLIDKLCAASRRRYGNPYEGLQWPDELARGQWFMSPELISIYGTPAWDALSEEQAQ
jgi:hypothetical protein